MTPPLYHLDQVGKAYGAHAVLQDLSMNIEAGEIVALVGPSGAGKSTLLRLLNFLERPSQGRIHYQGAVYDATQDMPLDLQRQVTTVFQRPILLNLRVDANVAYGLRLRGGDQVAKRVAAALEAVGLGSLAHHKARTLSGGEAQRVALARAIVLEPKVLLLDEPTANLDPYNVGLIEEIVRRLNAEHGTTTVLVTHNVFQAHRLAHRVGLLLDGCMVELASTAAFFESPRDVRTRAFVRGEMVY
jgi:tungstate transport system ATP-binding protein